MPKVLFVDDETKVLDAINRNLHKKADNWTLLFADNGNKAKEVLEEHSDVKVIVTDIMMPNLNGYELIVDVLKSYPGISPIVLSGHCDEHDRLEFERLGIPFFSKPLEIDELIEAISKLFGAVHED